MRCSVLAIVLAGCVTRPNPRVMCHNSNCSEPHHPAHDDTVDALRDSLALTTDGLPTIDGIELDLLRNNGQCLFAHDADHTANHVDIRDGIAVVIDHLATHERVSYRGDQFNVKLEMKPEVDGKDEIADEVTCALDVYALLRDAAMTTGHPIELVFDSYSPQLLHEMSTRRPPDEALIWTKLSIDFGVASPLRFDNYSLDELDVEVDIAEVHASWASDTLVRSLRSRGIELTLWSFDLTRETLSEISDLEPAFALTGQAQTLRAWLER